MSIRLLHIEVLPVEHELLLYLIEDLRQILVFHLNQSLKTFGDIGWHGVVEASPAELDVV